MDAVVGRRGFGGAGAVLAHLAAEPLVALVASRSLETEPWERQTSRLLSQGQAWTGNPVQLVEHTRRTFAALVRERNLLVDALRLEGIPLTAKIRRLLRNAA